MSLIVSLLFPLWMPVAELERIPLTFPNGKVIQVDVARTIKQREAGLMGRTHLAQDYGMIFVFKKAAQYDFWMKNTLVPLDMIWLDQDKRILYIAERVPPCKTEDCPSYGPTQKSLYVLELGAGMATEFELAVGDVLAF